MTLSASSGSKLNATRVKRQSTEERFGRVGSLQSRVRAVEKSRRTNLGRWKRTTLTVAHTSNAGMAITYG